MGLGEVKNQWTAASTAERCGTIEPIERSLAQVREYVPSFPDISSLPAPAEIHIFHKDRFLFGEQGPILTMKFSPDPGIRESEMKAFLDDAGVDSSHLSYENETGCTGTFSLEYRVPGGENSGYLLQGSVYGRGDEARVFFFPPERATSCREQEDVDLQFRIALNAIGGAAKISVNPSAPCPSR